MKVFIVDDSTVVVERLADLLKEVPGAYLAGQAGDALNAVKDIRKLKPDALILDLQMPGGSGLDVLRAIRADYPNLQGLKRRFAKSTRAIVRAIRRVSLSLIRRRS